MPATPGWPTRRKRFPHLASVVRGPPGEGIPVQASGSNAWVWLQEPPRTNQSEPAALCLPSCQVKQNTGNTNRIITINRLLEPDTGEPTPWHCHPLHGSRHDGVLGRLRRVWPVGIPAQRENLPLVCSHCHPRRSFQKLLAKPGMEEGLPSPKRWIAGKCPSHSLYLTNAACQGGNSVDTLHF